MAGIKAFYDRIAALYDRVGSPVERLLFEGWRRELFDHVDGKFLEVGVGTGRNFNYYPRGYKGYAIDFSSGMVSRAERKARELDLEVNISRMDVEDLKFEDDRFDIVVSTFVFCSVPNPVAGLREVGRVLKPSGGFLLMEHVLSDIPMVMELMKAVDLLFPGPQVSRRTVSNLKKAGFEVKIERNLLSDIVKFMVCTRGGSESSKGE